MREAIGACAIIAVLVLTGCASQGRRVPTDVEAVLTHEFNPTDLQLIGRQGAEKLLALVEKRQVFAGKEDPALYVSTIRNLTDEHIDTNMIGEYVSAKIQDTGLVRLIEPNKALDEAVKQLEFQQGAFVDPITAKKIGKMVGADYFIQGELSNIVAKAGWRKGQYFQFTLTLVDIETLEVWKSLIEIQKVSKRGLFGW
jgi:hypothetical protein